MPRVVVVVDVVVVVEEPDVWPVPQPKAKKATKVKNNKKSINTFSLNEYYSKKQQKVNFDEETKRLLNPNELSSL